MRRLTEHELVLDVQGRLVLRKVEPERPHHRRAVARQQRDLRLEVRPPLLPQSQRRLHRQIGLVPEHPRLDRPARCAGRVALRLQRH